MTLENIILVLLVWLFIKAVFIMFAYGKEYGVELWVNFIQGIYQIGSNMNKPTEVGKWYTFSVEVRGEGWAESSLMVGIESQGNDGKAGMIPDVKLTNGWTRYQTTFKAIKANSVAVYYSKPLRTGAWIEFRSPMLNEGKVTGGYQPAPEDIGIAVLLASFEVKADGYS